MLSEKFWNQLCDEWPDTKLFNHHLDDQFETPSRRSNIFWEDCNPKFFFGCDLNLNLYKGSKSCRPATHDVSLLPNSWQNFLKFLISNEYRDYISKINGIEKIKFYLNIVEDFADITEFKTKETYLNEIENNVSTLSKKYFKTPSLHKYKSPAMKIHPDTSDKTMTHLFYFNRDWIETYGGRLIFFNSFNENDVKEFVSIKGNVNRYFKVNNNSWHSIENFSVPKQTITRKSVQVSIYNFDGYHGNKN